MGLWTFIRAHLIPSIIIAVGVMLALIGYASDAYAVWTAGLKPWQLQAVGFIVFVIGVISLLYQAHRTTEARFAALSSPEIPALSPRANITTKPAAAATGARARLSKVDKQPAKAPPPIEAINAPRPKGRQYVPVSFVADLAKFISKGHTALQLQAFLEPHMRQWVRARGILATTTDHGTSITAHVRLTGDGSTLFVDFLSSWRSQLARISPGQQFDFDAQIVEDYQKRPCLSRGALL